MYPKRNDSFLYTCKESFFLGVDPLSFEARNSFTYKTLAEIAVTLFVDKKYNYFLNYLGEEKYRCNVWAAHLILEYGNPDMSMLNMCKEILAASYSNADGAFDFDV